MRQAGAELCQAQTRNLHVSWGWANINNWIPDFGLTGEDKHLLSSLLCWFPFIVVVLHGCHCLIKFFKKCIGLCWIEPQVIKKWVLPIPAIYVVFQYGNLPWRLSSFFSQKISNYFTSFNFTSVDIHMWLSKKKSFSAISLLARVVVV